MNKPLRFSVALLGARCHYAVPILLYRAGLLEKLFTDITADDWPAKLARVFASNLRLPPSAKRLMERRVPEIPRDRIKSFPLHGLARAFRHSRQTNSNRILDGYATDNSRFCKKVCRSFWGDTNAIYGFNGASLEIFRKAKKHELLCVLEQTIAPYSLVEPMLDEERKIWRNWEPTGGKKAWKLLAEREMKEWELSDQIICGSKFVSSGIEQLSSRPPNTEIIPYGIDLDTIGFVRKYDGKRPLRLLFIGTLELRKGIQYLSEAAENWPKNAVHFRAVGPSRLEETAMKQVRRNIEVIGPVSRSEIGNQLAWADAFVLPTLAEGSALVVYEALASGLPVVTTENAGSVITTNSEGALIPIRDANAIRNSIEHYLSKPTLIEEQSSRALECSSLFTVQKYGERLTNLFTKMKSTSSMLT
jgi:glycosyltransferase involved in cell wall biosynthesis